MMSALAINPREGYERIAMLTGQALECIEAQARILDDHGPAHLLGG